MVALRTYDKKNNRKHNQLKPRPAAIIQNTAQPYSKFLNLEQSAGNRSISRLMAQKPDRLDKAQLLADPNRFITQWQRGGAGAPALQTQAEEKDAKTSQVGAAAPQPAEGIKPSAPEQGGEKKSFPGKDAPGHGLVNTVEAQNKDRKPLAQALGEFERKPALNRIITDMKIPGISPGQGREENPEQTERALETGTERAVEQAESTRPDASREQIVRNPRSVVSPEALTQTELLPADIPEMHETIKESVQWLKGALSSPLDSLMNAWDWAKGNLGNISSDILKAGGEKAGLTASQVATLSKFQMMMAQQIGLYAQNSVAMGKDLEKKQEKLKYYKKEQEAAEGRWLGAQFKMIDMKKNPFQNKEKTSVQNGIFLTNLNLAIFLSKMADETQKQIVLLQCLIQQSYFLLGIHCTLLGQISQIQTAPVKMHEPPPAEPSQGKAKGKIAQTKQT